VFRGRNNALQSFVGRFFFVYLPNPVNLCAILHMRYINAIPSRNGHETCTNHKPNDTADPTRDTNVLYIVDAFSPIELNTAVVVASSVGIFYFIFYAHIVML